MTNLIKNIEFTATHILTKEESSVFSFQPICGINIFYCPNGFGKSSLFRILKEVFRLEDTIKLPIEKIQLEWYQLSKISILLQIQEKEYLLEYCLNEKTGKWCTNLAQDIKNQLINEVYNQKISDEEIEKKCFMDKRITVPSLNRYVFCSNDRIIANDSKDSDIIDSHRDGKAKGVLFDYILGSNFQNKGETIIQSIQKVYKFLKNEYDIQKLITQIEKNKGDIKDFGLFTPIQQEKIKEIKKKQDLFQDSNIALIDIEYALHKLSELSDEIWNDERYYDIKIIIQEELKNLTLIKKDYQNNHELVLSDLHTTIEEYSDWIDINYSQEKRDVEEVKKLEKENSLLKKNYKDYSKMIQDNRNKFIKLFTKFLEAFDYDNCLVDLDTLKLDISKIENYSEATLKLCRICFLLSLLLFKKENNGVRNLWIGFFDWLLDGVWYEKIQKLVNISADLGIQVFFFIPKLTSNSNEDEFLTFLSQNKKIKIFPIEGKEKIFTL